MLNTREFQTRLRNLGINLGYAIKGLPVGNSLMDIAGSATERAHNIHLNRVRQPDLQLHEKLLANIDSQASDTWGVAAEALMQFITETGIRVAYSLPLLLYVLHTIQELTARHYDIMSIAWSVLGAMFLFEQGVAQGRTTINTIRTGINYGILGGNFE